MADFIFNIAKGREAHYASLPAANDALVVVVLAASGLGTDATLADDDTLTQVLTHATEQTAMGRKTLAGVGFTVDDANDRVDITAANPVWTSATGVAVGKVVICYDPDTTTGSDADLVPLSAHDFVVTPNGGDITATISSPGFARAS